ncbi:MAG: hypothetical protein IK131_07040 [Paludibacteraceae bacterium]|nr:hypothetical protein [Paludibacteraceae bacterium]
MNSILDLFIQPQNTWNEGEDLILKPKKFPHPEYLVTLFIELIIGIILEVSCTSEERYKYILIFGTLSLPFLIATVVYYLRSAKIHPIIISANGIQTSTYDIWDWNIIDYACIDNKNKKRVFSIELTQDGAKHEENIDINKYKYRKDDIHKAVNFWSGRLIGANWNKFRDLVIEEKGLSDEEKIAFMKECERYVPLFLKEKTYTLIVCAVVFIILFPNIYKIIGAGSETLGYFKGIALLFFEVSFIYTILVIICNFMTKHFQKNPLISSLSEEEYKDFDRIANKETKYSDEDKTIWKYAIISILISIFCLFCYMILP